jgi:hypothetical protein
LANDSKETAILVSKQKGRALRLAQLFPPALVLNPLEPASLPHVLRSEHRSHIQPQPFATPMP